MSQFNPTFLPEEAPFLIIRAVPAAVFALAASYTCFETAFAASSVPSIPGVAGVYRWALVWSGM